ncbi:MAG: helix-turn-helix domain-containing protein [Pseudomonadota bacterium]
MDNMVPDALALSRDNQSMQIKPATKALSATEKATERAYHESFRRRLKDLREELQWSQADMANALGLSLDNYKKYEIRSKFPPHQYEKLALVTHKSVDFIVTGRINITQFRRRATS